MATIAGRIESFVGYVKAHATYLDHNKKLLDIQRGRLFPYIDEALKLQLHQQAYEKARQRIPPINVLQRINAKLSKIYSKAPTRIAEDDRTGELLSWYVDEMEANQRLGIANRYFNLFKAVALEPYLDTRTMRPRLRTIPFDRFIPVAYSDDAETPDAILTFVAKVRDARNGEQMIWRAVDKEGFCYFDLDKKDLTAEMEPLNPEGINPYQRLNYIYVNRDTESLVPVQDTDTLPMSVLLPLLLTDINFAHMFTAFSVVYGINLTDQGLVYSPGAFWALKSEQGSEAKPELGTLKPEADIDAGLSLVANQFALWLNTKGIKPGEVGEINASNFQSGVAKMLDEMDTSEDRNEQVPYFANAEKELWSLVLEACDPVWRAMGLNRQPSPATGTVSTTFPEQVPLVRRGAVIDEVSKEMEKGLTTRRRALKRLNPELTEAELDDLEKDIDEEKEANTPPEPKNQPPGEKGDLPPPPGGAEKEDDDAA
jgi:hypothetical protein